MRTHSLKLFPLTLLAVAALAGCGSDDEESDSGGDEAAVLEAVDGFYAGILDGDGEAACGQLTEEAVTQLESEATGLAPGTTCEDAVEQVVALFNEDAKQAIAEVEPSVTEITDTTAVVETTAINQAQEGTDSEIQEETIEINLVKEGEEWKISEFPQ